MEINKNIVDIIRFNGLPINESLTTLLILHFRIERDNSIMKDELISGLSIAGIVEYDYESGSYIIKEPLFEENVISLSAKPKLDDYKKRFPDSFVKEYSDIFKKINRERGSDKTSIRIKLGKLISERDKTVTNEEILEAAKLYAFRKSNEPKFIMQADYFIWHRDKGYSIMPYIEEIRENKNKGIENSSNKFEDTL